MSPGLKVELWEEKEKFVHCTKLGYDFGTPLPPSLPLPPFPSLPFPSSFPSQLQQLPWERGLYQVRDEGDAL